MANLFNLLKRPDLCDAVCDCLCESEYLMTRVLRAEK